LDRNERAVIREIAQLVSINRERNLFSPGHDDEYLTQLMKIEDAIREIKKLDPTIGY